MEEALIYREEVVQLLFSVSDIAESLRNIERMLGEEEDDGEEGEADPG